MTGTAENRDPVAERYESLIRSGVYTPSFSHGPGERQLVGDTLEPIIAALAARPAVILDCGCGPGAWLEVVAAIAARTGPGRADLDGFDITPGMIELARARLAGIVAPERLHVGDVLDPAAYDFDDGPEFDLVFTYDLVQQLPRGQQFAAIERMLATLGPGGTLVVFDHDRFSSYGRRMGLKKWLTRHLRIPLVPRFYIESAYPPLAVFARRLGSRSNLVVRIATGLGTQKQALIVRRLP
jgi:SAM-dependent methyltransferase